MKWIIFFIVSIAYILVFFHRFCAGVFALDMMRDLNTDSSLIGLLGAGYFYPYALMQIPAGILSDTIGSRKTISIFFIIGALGSFITSISNNVWMALFGRILIGIGASIIFVPTMKILTKWFKEKEFIIVTGLFISSGSIGTLTATSPLAYLSNIFGWRNVFIIIGFITIVISLFVWLIVRDQPDENKINKDIKIIAKIELNDIFKAIKLIIKNKHFWAIAICFFTLLGVFFTFTGLWGVPYLMQIYGFSKEKASNIISLFAFGMLIGNPLFSFLSEKIFLSRKKIILFLSFITVIIIFIFWFWIDKLSIIYLTILCFLFGFITNSIASIAFTSNKELFPIKIAGTATGLINIFPYIGAAIFQHTFGIILENTAKIENNSILIAYKNGFFMLLIFSIIGFLSIFFLKETFGKQHR